MNEFRALIKKLRTEVAEAEAKQAFLELLGDGDDVERLIGQRKAELASLTQQVAEIPAQLAAAATKGGEIVEAARRTADGVTGAVAGKLATADKEAASIVAIAQERIALADQAVAAAEAEGQRVLAAAQARADGIQAEAAAQVVALGIETETLKAERAALATDCEAIKARRDALQAEIETMKKRFA